MKAPAFDYLKPRSLDAVFELLASHGDEARLLAGGQTLLATLNMRLSEPALLIDITAIEALKGISVQGQVLRIGALVTHSEIEASALVAQHAPLLSLAVPHIAHRAIRNLGTWGGSIAYADPAAEWPCCLAVLDGVVVARSARGERRIAAKDFFLDLYTTALAEGEIVTACELPLAQAADLFRFDELARRHGDYAIVGLALAAHSVPGGLSQLKLAFLGLGTTPIRARRTEALFESTPFTTMQLGALMDSLLDELQPLADLTNSAATKRHLAGVLTRRLLASALAV
nr:xanthine dehydrogenase family protein subunit M [uncultured Roseateles sp.]